jgi:hypothetical protein
LASRIARTYLKRDKRWRQMENDPDLTRAMSADRAMADIDKAEKVQKIKQVVTAIASGVTPWYASWFRPATRRFQSIQ